MGPQIPPRKPQITGELDGDGDGDDGGDGGDGDGDGEGDGDGDGDGNGNGDSDGNCNDNEVAAGRSPGVDDEVLELHAPKTPSTGPQPLEDELDADEGPL